MRLIQRAYWPRGRMVYGHRIITQLIGKYQMHEWNNETACENCLGESMNYLCERIVTKLSHTQSSSQMLTVHRECSPLPENNLLASTFGLTYGLPSRPIASRPYNQSSPSTLSPTSPASARSYQADHSPCASTHLSMCSRNP
jgi:hypothetical protein